MGRSECVGPYSGMEETTWAALGGIGTLVWIENQLFRKHRAESSRFLNTF